MASKNTKSATIEKPAFLTDLETILASYDGANFDDVANRAKARIVELEGEKRQERVPGLLERNAERPYRTETTKTIGVAYRKACAEGDKTTAAMLAHELSFRKCGADELILDD